MYVQHFAVCKIRIQANCTACMIDDGDRGKIPQSFEVR